VGGFRLADQIPAAAIRQTDIGEEKIVGRLGRRAEPIPGALTTAHGVHRVPVALEDAAQELAPVLMILDHQNPARRLRSGFGGHLNSRRRGDRREAQRDFRTMAGDGRDRRRAAVPPHNAVHLGQPEPRPLRALGREERLEGAVAHLGAHADPGIAHGNTGVRAFPRRPHGERSAIGHGVDGVLHKIEQCLTNLAGDSAHAGGLGEAADDAHLAGFAGAAQTHGLGQVEHLVGQHRHVHLFVATRVHRLLTDEPPHA